MKFFSKLFEKTRVPFKTYSGVKVTGGIVYFGYMKTGTTIFKVYLLGINDANIEVTFVNGEILLRYNNSPESIFDIGEANNFIRTNSKTIDPAVAFAMIFCDTYIRSSSSIISTNVDVDILASIAIEENTFKNVQSISDIAQAAFEAAKEEAKKNLSENASISILEDINWFCSIS